MLTHETMAPAHTCNYLPLYFLFSMRTLDVVTLFLISYFQSDNGRVRYCADFDSRDDTGWRTECPNTSIYAFTQHLEYERTVFNKLFTPLFSVYSECWTIKSRFCMISYFQSDNGCVRYYADADTRGDAGWLIECKMLVHHLEAKRNLPQQAPVPAEKGKKKFRACLYQDINKDLVCFCVVFEWYYIEEL